MKVYVEIGANIGKDDFQKLIESLTERSRVILIEPNFELLDKLHDNYDMLKIQHEIIICPYGIALTNGTANIYLYPERRHSSLMNRRHNIPEGVTIRKADTMTFNALCDKFSITKIEYLSIDAEGLDYEILNSIDLSKVDIKTIVFEKWNIDNDDLNEKYRTGLDFLNSFILPKFKNYIWEDILLGTSPTYKLTKGDNRNGL